MTEFEMLLNQTKEYGIAEIVKYPIIQCTGLPSVRIDDLLLFETGQMGQVMGMNEEFVEAVTFSSDKIVPGTKVVRTGEKLSIEVGKHLLGKVMDPFGKVIFETTSVESTLNGDSATHTSDVKSREIEKRYIDPPPPRIENRRKITKQLITGVSVIDVVLPLAKGQRELIVGDRQTGKTWSLINVVKAQISLGSKVIYAIIGKEKTEIARVKELMNKNGLLKDVIIVATNSDDSPSLVSITPYAAMTHAEYFKDKGEDVLVIMDDMSTHAMYYREMSLMALRFPGRDSYPGDIFFKHARLLERAGNFQIKDKVAAITALPVAGTVNNMMTNHIVSNLIGITDGHLLFDAGLFNRGRRPAINVFLSVTRVGKQTQTRLMKALSREMMVTLSSYEDVLDFSHFGAELSDDKKALLKRGEKIYKFFEQPYNLVVPVTIEILFIGMFNSQILDETDVSEILIYRKNLRESYENNKETREKLDAFVNSYEKLDDFHSAIVANKDYLLQLCSQKK